MGFELVKLDHVDITSPEELQEDVATWYRDCLGLEELDTDREGARFSVGDSELHISIDPHNPPHTAHFCLIVDDYDAVVERLRVAGCHIEQAREIPGRHRFYTRDPAGNRVEIASVDSGER